MHASIRRYIVSSGREQEAIAHARDGVLPLFEREPGFVAYYFIDTDDGDMIAVSVFESSIVAQKANTIASAYVNEHLTGLLKRTMLLEGEVAVSALPQATVSSAHASIRRYIVTAGRERDVIEHSRIGILPLLERLRGFLAYFFIDTGDGELLGFSIFESKEIAQDANAQVAAYAAHHSSGHLRRMEILEGAVAVSAARYV